MQRKLTRDDALKLIWTAQDLHDSALLAFHIGEQFELDRLQEAIDRMKAKMEGIGQ